MPEVKPYLTTTALFPVPHTNHYFLGVPGEGQMMLGGRFLKEMSWHKQFLKLYFLFTSSQIVITKVENEPPT